MGARQPKFACVIAALLVFPFAGGCTVVSIAEDKALRERSASGFNAADYVEGVWSSRAAPYWAERRRPLSTLLPLVRQDLAGAGRAHGRRAGDGSPWVFVVAGEGAVRSVEPGRRGRATVVVAGVAEPIVLQTGPVVSGAALRDSLPFIQFDDFANQLVYADVAQALTRKALAATSGATRGIAVGDTVRFEGVVPVLDAGDALVVTPYSLTRSGS